MIFIFTVIHFDYIARRLDFEILCKSIITLYYLNQALKGLLFGIVKCIHFCFKKMHSFFRFKKMHSFSLSSYLPH